MAEPMSDDRPPARPGLGRYLAEFEAPGFTFDDWRGRLTPTAQAFVRDAYDLGWVRGDVDWGTWSETAEATTLRDDPTALARADRDQISKLLTTLIRLDRFSGGTLGSAFSSGVLTGIVRRIAALEGDGSG
ncbi:MAG TPA: DUF6508 domain-containing protein [Candidatus Limnocylindrales bacterium]